MRTAAPAGALAANGRPCPVGNKGRPLLPARGLSRAFRVTKRQSRPRCSSESEIETEETSADELSTFESDLDRRRRKIEELRKAETFMVVDAEDATCSKCGYEYSMKKGDPQFPIAPGTNFEELPTDYQCPLCGAPKAEFKSKQKVVAGFAANQGYGFGGNSLTAEQKQLLIWSSFGVAVALFLSGYLLT